MSPDPVPVSLIVEKRACYSTGPEIVDKPHIALMWGLLLDLHVCLKEVFCLVVIAHCALEFKDKSKTRGSRPTTRRFCLSGKQQER